MSISTFPVITSKDVSSLQTVIDSIPIAVLLIGSNGLYLDCNGAALRIFDASSRDDLIGKSPALLSPKKQRNGNDSVDEAKKYQQKVHNSGLTTFYFDHKTLSGTIFPAKVTLQEISYEGEACRLCTIADMTGEVRIEEIQALTDKNPYALIKLNPNLTIADVNPAFSIISGYTKEEWIGRQVSDFKIIKRDGPSPQDAVLSQSPVRGKYVADFPTGITSMEYTYIPVFDAEGDLEQIITIFSDLTELETKIHESNTLIKENPASILSLDIDGKILSVNPAFLDVSRISEEKLLTMNVKEFKILERDGLSLSETISVKKASKGRLVSDFGWAVKTLDFTYIPIFDINNTVTSLVAMYIDVSDQVVYINEIEAFIRDNPHAIMMINPDMSITNANPACSQLLGYTEQELSRMKLTDMPVLEREGQTVQDAFKTKKMTRGSLISNTPSGKKHFDIVYIPILDKKGVVIKLIEIFSDMTTIRSMVTYLKQSVDGVQKNISSLAKGDTTFSVTILDADEHSASAREEFVKIGQAIEIARKAITQLVTDTNAIAQAAIAGDMKYRSDSSVHQGDYRAIIEGLNLTLDSIAVPIKEAMKIADNFANYNFTARFDPSIPIKGDWVQFKEALNNLGIQVSAAISQITKNVSELAASAEEANASVEEVISGSHQITTNTTLVSQNAEQGGDGISQVLKAMEDLNETVGAVSRKAESVSVASDESNKLTKEGIALAKQSDSAMGEITQTANEVDTIVTGINSQMDEIGKIVRLISDIASQTNLLALNAAIEAARAGEAGRGFAVVAAEVKSLAQDSRKSAENIADMIAALQTKAKQATEAMGKSTLSVKEGSSALEQTLIAFNKIADTIEEINKSIVDVASASEEQAASVEEVTASIQEVANLVKNTSDEAGNAAAATEEASASIDEIGRIMTGVVQIAENIAGEMSKFKVD